jgi:hypothetical protein
VTAKHGQNPRTGVGGIMADSTLPDLLQTRQIPVANATQDDVSLLWLQNQAQTLPAVTALQNFKQTGTLDVYYQGQLQTVPAKQVINQILYGQSLQQAGLGNPLQDSTTPDIVVTLHPGFIWVGNPQHFQFKRAEHGGFSAPDAHVALTLDSGGLPGNLRGTRVVPQVSLQQLAVTALEALGLNPNLLQGAVIDGTVGLPGLGLSAPAPEPGRQAEAASTLGSQSDLGPSEMAALVAANAGGRLFSNGGLPGSSGAVSAAGLSLGSPLETTSLTVQTSNRIELDSNGGHLSVGGAQSGQSSDTDLSGDLFGAP